MSLRAAASVVALLVAVVALCAAPALLGSFVYDDQLVRSHPWFDGWPNVALAFQRTSHDYSPDMLNAASGSTYRPVSVVSLVITSVLFGRLPLPHHVLSFGLHALTTLLVALLGAAWHAHAHARSVPRSWLVVCALFALHPIACETFQWISGRNDLLAGCALAGVMLLLRVRLQGVAWAQRSGLFLVASAALLAFGALCKEPFLIAATFLLLAELCQRGALRRLWPALLALLAAVACTSLLRTFVAPPTRSARAILLDGAFLLRIPRALALALESLLAPAARPMRSWSWELEQPWTVVQGAALALALTSFAWLLWRRQLRAAVLLLGAAATLAPTAAVADYFWLGLDRYVLLPLLLLLAALAPAASLIQRRLDALGATSQRWLGLAAAGLACWLAFSSWSTASTFAGQAEFARALIRARPADPSGYLVGLSSLSDSERPSALAYLRSLTERDLPPAFVHAVVTAQSRFGLYREVVQTLERAAGHYPQSAHIRFDLLELRGAQHRFAEGLELSDGLLRDARLCPVARAKLLQWDGERGLPESVRERLRAQLDAHPCG